MPRCIESNQTLPPPDAFLATRSKQVLMYVKHLLLGHHHKSFGNPKVSKKSGSSFRVVAYVNLFKIWRTTGVASEPQKPMSHEKSPSNRTLNWISLHNSNVRRQTMNIWWFFGKYSKESAIHRNIKPLLQPMLPNCTESESSSGSSCSRADDSIPSG